jgi:phosphoglycerate dehydrogenase-like enzyme
MSDPQASVGPGRGPKGQPLAIALTPILSARYRERDLDQIRAVAPDARLVTVAADGHADGPIDDVEVLLRGFLPAETFDRLLARAPLLAWVHSASAGVERVLTPSSRRRGVVITNARGVFSEPIAEYVLMMILAVSRRLPQLLELQRERTWQPLQGTELRDITIGIVGFGSIGRAVAERARAFGCRIVATRRRGAPIGGEAPHASDGTNEGAGTNGGAGTTTGAGTNSREDTNVGVGTNAQDPGPFAGVELLGGPEALPDLMRESDFVVLALPLTPETQESIDAAVLALAKPGAWLINVARGRLIHEPALLRALRDGRLGGAILDTFTEEPLSPASPYYELANVIVTPHTSWSSGRVLDRSIALFCDNLRRYADGRPLVNVVDPAAGY